MTALSAKDTADFLFTALREPEAALAREDMGPIHTALAPHLRNWMRNKGTRHPAMVAAVGSINYDCVVASSDVDMKAVYFPSFEDMYHGRYPKFSFVTSAFDCELHPVQAYKKHALKGNINFFEPLYSQAAIVYPDFLEVSMHLRHMVEMNIQMTALATFFTAEQQNKGIDYKCGSGPDWGYKKASHCLRLLVFLINLIETGKIDLVPREPFKATVKGLKEGTVSYQEYCGLADELHDVAKGMLFKRFEHGGNYEFSDAVVELDHKGSARWVELDQETDRLIMNIIRGLM